MAHLKKMLNKMVSNLNRHSAWLLLQPVEWCRWYTRFQHRRVWSVCQYQCLFVLGNNDPLRTFPRKLNIKVLTQSICQCTFKNLELNLYSLLTNWRQPNKNLIQGATTSMSLLPLHSILSKTLHFITVIWTSEYLVNPHY